MNGCWRKPKYSPRTLARMRKEVGVQEGIPVLGWRIKWVGSQVIALGQVWEDPRPVRVPKERHPLARVGPKGRKRITVAPLKR